jgi:hypothetical protein
MAKYGALAGAAVAAVGAFCSYEARVLHLHSSPGDGFQVLASFLFLVFLVCGESLSSCLFWIGHRVCLTISAWYCQARLCFYYQGCRVSALAACRFAV